VARAHRRLALSAQCQKGDIRPHISESRCMHAHARGSPIGPPNAQYPFGTLAGHRARSAVPHGSCHLRRAYGCAPCAFPSVCSPASPSPSARTHPTGCVVCTIKACTHQYVPSALVSQKKMLQRARVRQRRGGRAAVPASAECGLITEKTEVAISRGQMASSRGEMAIW